MGKQDLAPLPYHTAIRDFLKREDPRVWEWFASHKVREEQTEAVKFDLLKSTYRIDRTADPRLYEIADQAATSLALTTPITIYQSQNPQGVNAGLAYIPSEAHLVLSGPVKTLLNEAELSALMGHELSHYLLWRGWDGELLIAEQLLAALTHDAEAHAAHIASARLFQLYTEIFCDRGALAAVDDPLVVISMLVKMTTGLDQVNAESYVRQADEVFQRESAKTAGISHPEAFIRARAIQLWHDGDQQAAAKIAEMIEGASSLDDLDLLGQEKIAAHTRRLIDALLTPKWLQSDLNLAHARLFFTEYASPKPSQAEDSLNDDLRTDDASLRDYYCYVLLDFAVADRELDEAPLAATLQLAERMGLKDRYAEIAKKELKLSKKQFDAVDGQKDVLVEQAAREALKA